MECLPEYLLRKGVKMGEDCILFLMFCSSRARLSCLLFSARQTKREERWRGRDPGGEEVGRAEGRRGGGGEGRGGGCWHALVSNLFECIAQFICFVSTATAEDNQTRRPLDTSYCPPLHSPPFPHAPPPLQHPVTRVFLPQHHFFFHVTCWLKEARQFTSIPQMGENVRKGTHIKTMLSWWYSMVQNLQTSTQPLTGCSVYKHARRVFFFYMPRKINTVAFLCVRVAVVFVLVSLWTKEKQ